ncbi:MAG TPA: hypothetical protein VH170_01925 [Chthoniobacterales bacterium]|nr:hypothetical protein [Chthoniobacterales bacterium]
MKSFSCYGLSAVAALSLLCGPSAFARPMGFSEVSLLVRMHEPEASIKNEVADRKLLHQLTQPQENILKQQGASDSLLQSLRDSKLIASKEEAAAVENAPSHAANTSSEQAMAHSAYHRHVVVFDVAFGHPINLSQWGGLDYEIAFYSYRFAGEDHIQPALIDTVGTRTVAYRSTPFLSEGETFNSNWFPTNGVRNWRFTPYNGVDYDNRGDFRDARSINFSDTVSVSSSSVSRPVAVDWDAPQFFDGEPYTFYPVYGGGGVSLYYINSNSYSARVAVAFSR